MSTKVTKSEKALSFMGVRRNFSRGDVHVLFIIFKLLTIGVPILFHCFAVLQVRENKILLCNSTGGPEYLRTQREHCWPCNANGQQNALSFLHYKENAPCYGNNHKKRFVGSSSQVY